MGSFDSFHLHTFAGGLDIRAVQINKHFAEDVVNFILITGQLLIAFVQQPLDIVLQNVVLFDGEGVNERQRPPFKDVADIIPAYIDECVGKGEAIGKGTVVDDIPRGTIRSCSA
jgi:hypothetical protein